MKYEITQTTDGYIHHVEFTDSNGTSEIFHIDIHAKLHSILDNI